MQGYIVGGTTLLSEIGNTYRWEDGMMRSLPEPTKWNFESEWGLTDEQFNSLFRKGVADHFVWWTGRPIRGSVDALWRLESAGWNIRIITNRLVHKFGHKQAINATADWLDKYNVPYWDLFFTGRTKKSDVEADAYIDDNPDNLPDWVEYPWALLFDRKWNRDSGRKGFRVNGWKEVNKTLAKT